MELISNTMGQDNKMLILFHERKVDYESYVRNIIKLFSAGNNYFVTYSRSLGNYITMNKFLFVSS